MNLLTIPLRNIRRRPSKSLLLVTVFSLGVMSIVALFHVSQVVGQSLEKKLAAFGANIVVAPATETLSVSYGGFHMGDMLFDIQDLQEDTTVRAIHAIALNDRISAVAPKLVTMTQVRATAVALVGVRWQQERSIKSYWAVDGRFPEHPEEILVGAKAAKALGLTIGDNIVLHGEDFHVTGLLQETGGDDDTVILADLEVVQALIERPGAASFIEVAALCSGCPIEDIVAQLRAGLPNTTVTALQHVVNQRMASVHFVQQLALSISLVILVTAAAMVGLSMLAAVNERRKDIGILRSLGYARTHIFLVFCLEAGLMGALSGLAGYLTGYAASLKAIDFLALADGTTPPFSPGIMAMTVLIFSLVTVIAALIPAWKGAAVEPSAALSAL